VREATADERAPGAVCGSAHGRGVPRWSVGWGAA
jgi:hypothetical protein